MRKFTLPSHLTGALALTAIALLVITEACRKVDRFQEQEPVETLTQRFFQLHEATDPAVKAVVNFVKRENTKYRFIKKLTARIGMPYWNKALVFSKNTSSALSRSTSIDSAVVVYVPFARDSQRFVNAALLVKMTASDTVFQLLYDWQYADFGFTSVSDTQWNAKNIFHIFTKLDNSVFGTTKFRVKDKDLLTDGMKTALDNGGWNFDSVKMIYKFAERESNVSGRLVIPVETCQPFEICLLYCLAFRNSQAQRGPDYCCRVWEEWEACTTTWVDFGGDDGGGLGIDEGGGITSGGGGGWTPPDPCNNGPQGRTSNPCGSSGWEPVIEDEPPVQEPVDSMLNKYARKINHIADSVFALSQANNEEWGFIIVENAVGEIYAKGCTTSHDPGYVKLDKRLAPGEKIVAELHTHPAEGNNPLDRSAPSGDDFNTLKINSRDRYFSFIDCGTIRYAIVVEKVDSSRNFFQLPANSIDYLTVNQQNIAQTKPNWVANWQYATELALLDLIGNSSMSGIGIYKSDTTKTNFLKLN